VQRYLLFLLVGLLFALSVRAQDADADADSEQTENTEEIEEADVEDEEIDESNLDEQGFTDVDDDFRPSEDIPADQSIPFPTDI
jgi:hypothetical protein